MTRQEYIDWCKKRALEYVATGDLDNAMASMISDLGKHSETAGHSAIGIFVGLKAMGNLNTPDTMDRFINGFN